MTEPVRKIMYRCEKFSPRNCPHCGHQFRQQNDDWVMYMGTIVDGNKVPDPLWPRIICKACNGDPIKQIKIKEYRLESEIEIDRLISDCDFFNKQESEAFGNMTKDSVMNYDETNQPKLEMIRCDE